MARAEHNGHNGSALAHQQGTDPFGSVELVPGKCQQVYTKRCNVQGDLTQGLGGVGVKRHSAAADAIGVVAL